MDFDKFEVNKNKQIELIEKLRLADFPDNRVYQNQLETLFEEAYGFKSSYESMKSVDDQGEPIPWMTYPAIFYLDQLDLSKLDLFEWGGGNSSLFFSKRVKSLFTIESDKKWYDYVQSHNLANVSIHLESNDTYASVIQHSGKKYDVISIDGDIYRRFECANYAVESLKDGGMIILDNSDWLPNTTAFLREKGFVQIDFAGPGPINGYVWCTSLFLHRSFSIPNKGLDQPGFVNGGLQNKRD